MSSGEEFLSYWRTSLFLCACTLGLVYFATKKDKRKTNYPPGPPGLPCLGNALQMFFRLKELQVVFTEMAMQYGDVFSVYAGSHRFVVLNNAKVIKDVINKPELLGRPSNSVRDIAPMELGPYFNNHKQWQEHRLFSVQAFKEIGVGRAICEEKIKDEVSYFIGILGKTEGKPYRVKSSLQSSLSNIVAIIIFGERYDFAEQDSECIKHLHDVMKIEGREFRDNITVVAFPFMKYFISYYKNKSDLQVHSGYDQFIKKQIQKCKEKSIPTEGRTYLEKYLDEAKKRKSVDPDTHLTEEEFGRSIAQLYAAGTETVRIHTFWLWYLMASYPDVQKKVHDEIDAVIGRKRIPCFADQKHLPYTHSLLMEVQRWRTVLPLGVPRMALSDTSIQGYTVPEGTTVVANLYGVHHNPAHFKDPEEFIPERFLSPDGRSIVKDDNFIPFSYGKRNCLGEALAVMEVFLYFVCTLQKFTIKLPEGEKPDFESTYFFSLDLDKKELCFVPL